MGGGGWLGRALAPPKIIEQGMRVYIVLFNEKVYRCMTTTYMDQYQLYDWK